MINYDETNFSNDPARLNVICKRGIRYCDSLLDSTKTSISVMMVASAAGDLLKGTKIKIVTWIITIPSANQGGATCFREVVQTNCRSVLSSERSYDRQQYVVNYDVSRKSYQICSATFNYKPLLLFFSVKEIRRS